MQYFNLWESHRLFLSPLTPPPLLPSPTPDFRCLDDWVGKVGKEKCFKECQTMSLLYKLGPVEEPYRFWRRSRVHWGPTLKTLWTAHLKIGSMNIILYFACRCPILKWKPVPTLGEVEDHQRWLNVPEHHTVTLVSYICYSVCFFYSVTPWYNSYMYVHKRH